MARTKAELGPGVRLSDYLSASLLARMVSPELIHRSLDEHGANSLRVRRLRARSWPHRRPMAKAS